MAKAKTVDRFDPKKPTALVTNWADGEVSVYDIARLPAAVVEQLTFHGLKQKLMDAHSGTFKETGSPAECRKVTDAVWANLLNGEFNSDRTGSPWIIEALAEIFDVEEEQAAEIWGTMDKAAQKAAYADPAVVKWKAARDLARVDGKESAIDLAGMFGKKAKK